MPKTTYNLWSFERLVSGDTIFLIASYLLFASSIAYSQTSVTPVLSLQDPATIDQDDMCIWVHPDPSLSTIIASDKYAYKLFVYDLNGNTLQTITVPGQPGNIDVRYNFLLSGQLVDIVGYNDRDNEKIVLHKVNQSDRSLVQVANFDDGNMSGEIYGFCLYRSPNNGKHYAIASSTSSQMRQWELIDAGNGSIDGIERRTWQNGSGDQTEGLVADDENANLYAANEGLGIYKYDADPDNGNPIGDLIAPTGVNGLLPDVEGITLYYAANGEGYLIASSQGSDDFRVYNRKEPHNFITAFAVNGANNTDGIDITNVSMGSIFPEGMFAAHSGSRAIRLCDYADTGLNVDTSYWNPRKMNDINLPVLMAYFNATNSIGRINLDWATHSEVSNWEWIVYRREGDHGEFEEIRRIPGAGNTNTMAYYHYTDTDVDEGRTYYYRLANVDFDGTVHEYPKMVQSTLEAPMSEFALYPNYPNPFNNQTTIHFELGEQANTVVDIFDILGRRVKRLVNHELMPGSYKYLWNGQDKYDHEISSGIYIITVSSGDYFRMMRMVLSR